MAKTSKIVKNEERKVLVARYADKRRALQATIKNPKTTDEERAAAYSKLRKLPRNTLARPHPQPLLDDRAAARLRGLLRPVPHRLRDMALNGLIPGVRKASW